MSMIQSMLRVVYPPRCVACDESVDSDFGLCGACWRETPFIEGLCCDACGRPLPGVSDRAEYCDDCLTTPRPWKQGRAAFLYEGMGRKLTMALKHGDKHEIVHPAALWLSRAARDILNPNAIVAPIPLHWTRLLKRRFNQSALIAKEFAAKNEMPFLPDLLVRHRKTLSLGGQNADERFETLNGAIGVHQKHAQTIQDKPVLLIDDVMTSGATMTAAAQACLDAGARDVSSLVLARVAKGGEIHDN